MLTGSCLVLGIRCCDQFGAGIRCCDRFGAGRHYGPAHPIFASCLNNIALLNKTLGNLELATEQYEKTVQAYVDALGMDNTR